MAKYIFQLQYLEILVISSFLIGERPFIGFMIMNDSGSMP